MRCASCGSDDDATIDRRRFRRRTLCLSPCPTSPCSAAPVPTCQASRAASTCSTRTGSAGRQRHQRPSPGRGAAPTSPTRRQRGVRNLHRGGRHAAHLPGVLASLTAQAGDRRAARRRGARGRRCALQRGPDAARRAGRGGRHRLGRGEERGSPRRADPRPVATPSVAAQVAAFHTSQAEGPSWTSTRATDDRPIRVAGAARALLGAAQAGPLAADRAAGGGGPDAAGLVPDDDWERIRDAAGSGRSGARAGDRAGVAARRHRLPALGHRAARSGGRAGSITG